ncbi:MAG: hypothetical protein CI949_4100, partial [Halanaerobium sp.]
IEISIDNKLDLRYDKLTKRKM